MTVASKALTITNRSYPEELMYAILPRSVVCGQEKDSYRSSCTNGGVKSIDVDYALAYKYLRYATTFKRHNQPHAEVIKCFIIDVDYKFKPTLNEAHSFVTDHIMPPTFTTQTDKGYQFIYGLSSSFFLTASGEPVATKLNLSIMDKFKNADIKIDVTASTRLVGTFRNPLAHDFKYHNKLYNVTELINRLPKSIHTSHSKPLSAQRHSVAPNKGNKSQVATIESGFIDGNKNEYFYLLANKAAVESNMNSYNESLMICRSVAMSLNTDDVAIVDAEVKATAAQLWRYKSNNKLFMPRVFCTGTAKPNAGKYRLELNATIGFTTKTDRRAAAMKLIQRDRKLITADKIREAVADMDAEEFELTGTQGMNTICKRVAKKAELGLNTVKRHIQQTPSLLTVTINTKSNKDSYPINKYVLDYMGNPLVKPVNKALEAHLGHNQVILSFNDGKG